MTGASKQVPGQPWSLLLLVLVLLALLPRNYARAAAEGNPPPRDQVPEKISVMPMVIDADLDRTGRRLASAGFRVIVRREKTPAAGGRVLLKEIERAFRPGEWSHMIAAQYPPPGTHLSPDTVVTLVAGIHHGAGPYRPWLETHGGAVKLRGQARCRDCHTAHYCSSCHEAAGRN
jgi:hypothetical protein